VLGLLALIGLMGMTPAPAQAQAPRVASQCTVDLADADAVRTAAAGADAVFAARVVQVRQRKVPAAVSGGGQTRVPEWTVRVLARYQGVVSARRLAGVLITAKGDGKVKRPAKHATYLFFAQLQGRLFSASECGGAVRLAHGLTPQLGRRLTADLQQSSDQGVDVHLDAPSGGARDLPHLGRLVAPGAGVALFGVLGLLLVGRLGRER